MSRSIVAKGVSSILSLKPSYSEEKRNKEIESLLSRGERESIPTKLLKTRYVDSKNGRIFYANEKSDSNITIIYIHGGAYWVDFIPFHWAFIKKLIKKTNAKVIAPAYRLAPFGTYKDAFNLIVPIYEECIKTNDKVILMGDSAGGGLALALSIHFKLNGIRMPDELILLSPWVDVAMDNEEIKEYTKKDPMLTVESLRASAKLWQGELDSRDWHVSPLYGDLVGIHNVTIFAGTREIFCPDIIKLYKKLDKDSNNKLIIGEDMNHAYPLMPIPEAKDALQRIVKIILK